MSSSPLVSILRHAVRAFLAVLLAGPVSAQTPERANDPGSSFHLTARPWQPLGISRDAYLDAIEGLCRFTARHLDKRGAVIDPFLHREHQYSTPYFAVAVGALLAAGRAEDLKEAGLRAMDHATECFAKGNAGIPDGHGEFFLAALPLALDLYAGHVPAEKLAEWSGRLRATPREKVVGKLQNNWRAYAMKGEWRRAERHLAERDEAVNFIENGWLRAEQQNRIGGNRWNLYEDRGTFPESHAVEGVGRGNLLSLVEEGYDGPSAGEMRESVERGSAVSLLLQDPTGQCPPDGRADDHVWNDVLYQLCFEVMAERELRAGQTDLAGQYRHAAMLSFSSIARWRRDDGDWAGSYYVTKNHFDPARRVGYQAASNYGNYNGALMLHLAEAWLTRKSDIPERPAPCEIGGYAFETDAKFNTAVANAGGMQMFVALRGDTTQVYNRYWTALGVARFSRSGWDSRLGPSDGEREPATGRGLTFAPTWLEDGKWIRLADVPQRYRGKFSASFVHPLLVRCAIDYEPFQRGGGPAFHHEFILTPEGVLATLHSQGSQPFGVTWPLLTDDGAALHTGVTPSSASAAYSVEGDQENFLQIGDGGVVAEKGGEILSTYGLLLPVRAGAGDGVNRTFIYPRSGQDPAAETVHKSFRITDDGFESALGWVHGSLYAGPSSAGGEGNGISLRPGAAPDVTFDVTCKFVLQLRKGHIAAIETDRKCVATLGARKVELEPYSPRELP